MNAASAFSNRDDVDCDQCGVGIAERVCDDWASDTGAGYAPVNGSSVEFLKVPGRRWDVTWRCAGCTAANAGFLADFGVLVHGFPPPRSERDWRFAFEIAHDPTTSVIAA